METIKFTLSRDTDPRERNIVLELIGRNWLEIIGYDEKAHSFTVGFAERPAKD
jgi:hypothetical protein